MIEEETEPTWIRVYVGEFSCPHCGSRWVGRWNGPKEKMRCYICEKLLSEDPEEDL